MSLLTVDNIIEATGGELLQENGKSFSGVSIDSRTIRGGEMFVAIRGDRFDGHDFIPGALEKGSGALVERKPESLPEGRVIIWVKDTLRSLQDMARFVRVKQDIPVVAVTGSNGKTTTKEMIYSILSGKYKTLKNEGNLNNLIGLPLSLLRLAPDDEMIVLEMGMNAKGEIRRLCEIALPDYGVITNIGSAHVGTVGGYEAVRSAKLEILEGLGLAVVNADDAFLMQGIEAMEKFNGRMITYGIHTEAAVMARDVRATETGSDFIMEIEGEGSGEVHLPVYGIFNVYNALAASAAARALGMSRDEIRTGLEHFRAFSMRFEVSRRHGITIINDSYNANPSSIRESVKELIRLRGRGRAVAILGDMFELGEFSETEHRDIGRMAARAGVDVIVAVGDMMNLAAEEFLRERAEKEGAGVFVFKNVNEAKKNIMAILKQGDTALIKGSRAMTMERILEGIDHAL